MNVKDFNFHKIIAEKNIYMLILIKDLFLNVYLSLDKIFYYRLNNRKYAIKGTLYNNLGTLNRKDIIIHRNILLV